MGKNDELNVEIQRFRPYSNLLKLKNICTRLHSQRTPPFPQNRQLFCVCFALKFTFGQHDIFLTEAKNYKLNSKSQDDIINFIQEDIPESVGLRFFFFTFSSETAGIILRALVS